MKGRIVLNVGNFFHFLSIKREDIYRQKSEYPVKRLNLSKEYEKRVNNKNVLRVAMKTGIARMIYHLVSPEVYKEQTRLIEDGIRDGTIKDIWLSADKISTHERGSERVVTVSMPDLSESVLLVLDASYFSYADEGILNRLLNESKIETDLLIFNLERDNADVTMLERQRLKAFADGFAK
jgi:hypothetical protein